MACILKSLPRFFTRVPLVSKRVLHTTTKNGKPSHITSVQVMCVIGGTVAVYTAYKCKASQSIKAYKSRPDDKSLIKLTSRERRFIRFASVQFDGQLYMTPQDFLESVVEAEPRPRLKRRLLTQKDMEEIKDSTPVLAEGSNQLFRDLRNKGIISYTEYLFLLSILTKPQSGFRIAFNMFDTDGNEQVDKNEFLVVNLVKKCSVGDTIRAHG